MTDYSLGKIIISEKSSIANEAFMREALNQAEIALKENEIPVGCVIVKCSTQQIIAKGYNKTNESRNGTK